MSSRDGLFVLRAELTLAREDRWPLREVPLSPDPLSAFAVVMGRLDPTLGEEADVCIDLLPLAAGQLRRWRRRVEKADRAAMGRDGGVGGGGRSGSVAAELWAAANDGGGGRRPAGGYRGGSHSRGASGGGVRRDPFAVGTVGAREATRDVADKAYSYDPAFAVQVLVRVVSASRARAREHERDLITAFGVFSGANSFKEVGVHVGQVCVGGAGSWWRRGDFDRRFAQGRFGPAKRKVVIASEILGLLKPPTKDCTAANVLRSGGVVPAPPSALPTYTGQSDLLPWGIIKTPDGERPVGVPLADTLFALRCGKAGFGKTEMAIVQFVALARAGHGCMFLDPHADAIAKIKPYLVDIADRVIEIDMSPRGRGALQGAWNVFDMGGRGEDDIEGRVSAVVASFASSLKWNVVNNRALTLTTMAAQSMVELALILPAGLAPTIFQMATILNNETWRKAVAPHLSAPTAQYWADEFDRLAAAATTPVTNLISRLRQSATVAAVLGSSRSSYDIAAAMDEGKVVLACPGGGEKGPLIANLLIYDVLQALLGRGRNADIPAEARRLFFLFVDELQTVDGASGGNLAALLEESRKFGGRMLGMVQQLSRLTDTTREAMLNNLSHLSSTNVSESQAKLVAAEWAGKVNPDTLTQLPQYNWVSSVMLNGRKTTPFRSRGFELAKLFGDVAHPDAVGELDATVNAAMARRPVGTVVAELDTLNDRIVAYLHGRQPAPPADSPVGPFGRPRDRSGSGAHGLALVRTGR